MNDFSRLLSSIVSKKEASITQMAAFCQVDRSSMYKILHGRRKPASESLVSLISLYLKLSPEEAELLMEQYRILQIGRENYFRIKAAHLFLQSCFDRISIPAFPFTAGNEDMFNDSGQFTQGKVMYGETNIMGACVYITQKEMEKENGLLCIRMQPNERFTDMIRAVIGSGGTEKYLRVQHIIALDGNDILGDSNKYNLDLFRSVLPAFKSIPDYELYYYYTNLHDGKVDFFFLPYAVISSTHVLQFTGDLQFAILHTQPEIICFFKKVFSGLLSGSISLALSIRDYRDLLYYRNRKKGGRGPVSLQMYPVMNRLMTEDLLEKYIRKDLPHRTFFIRAVLEVGQKELLYLTTTPAILLTSENGLRNFMENGTLPEYPADLYNPLLPEDRIGMLRRYEETIRKYPLTFRILRSPYRNVRSESSVWLEDTAAGFLFKDDQGKFKILFIRDPGILALLRDFFQNLPDFLFYSPEESLQILHTILQEYTV